VTAVRVPHLTASFKQLAVASGQDHAGNGAVTHNDTILLPSPEDAARTLGGDLQPDGMRILCPGPYHSGADRSLSVRFDADAPDGFMVCSFGGDDPLACKDYIREKLGLPEFGSRGRTAHVDREALARKRAEDQAQRSAHTERQREKARYIWGAASRPALGSPAARYLRERRKLTVIPDTVRCLPAKGDYPPSMIVAYGLPDEPEPGRYQPLPASRIAAVHITRLRPDGTDRERERNSKFMLGSPGTMPIALIPPNDLGGLVVAEGVETALSFAHTGLGCWAAGSKDRLVTIAPSIAALPYVKAVTVAPDEDGDNVDIPSIARAEQLADMLADMRPDIDVRIA
jgi:hypothetical protein